MVYGGGYKYCIGPLILWVSGCGHRVFGLDGWVVRGQWWIDDVRYHDKKAYSIYIHKIK